MEVLERLRDSATDAFAGEPVAFAYLFGSHADSTTTSRSDVDIAVHLTDDVDVDLLDLRLRLASALEHAAGVGPVEVVILDEAPLSLAGQVYEHGRLFFSIDEPKRVRYESLTARMYHDFKYHEERVAQERLRIMAGRTGVKDADG